MSLIALIVRSGTAMRRTRGPLAKASLGMSKPMILGRENPTKPTTPNRLAQLDRLETRRLARRLLRPGLPFVGPRASRL